MAYHFDLDTLDINHDLIAADAERQAHADVARHPNTTYEAAYAKAHARYLDCAQGQVASRLFIRERDAARAKMSERERRIDALREAAHLAPMIDNSERAYAEQQAAERELAALLAEPV